MIWLLGALWGWLVLAALLGAAVTTVWSLRKVTVSTIRVGTLEVPEDPTLGPADPG
jgi:hypothetical protein